MSNNKKIITQKDLARSLGNKTPVQVVTSMLTKKHGKYRLNGSKAEKKIARSACQHHIVDKQGNIKPRVEYSSDNKTVRCQICGAIIPTAFFEDATVEKRTDQAQQVISEKNVETYWDKNTSQNYGTYEEDNSTYQIWLEDAESIAAKVKLASKYKLAGVAAWKLGFENSGIWQVITDNLQ